MLTKLVWHILSVVLHILCKWLRILPYLSPWIVCLPFRKLYSLWIAKLYSGQRAVIRIDGELSGCCIIGQGVRQWCPLSPLLFNRYIQYVINEALEDIQEGVKVGGVLIPAIQFVRGLQVIMDALQDTSEKYNMTINTKKTKIMRMSSVERRTMNHTVDILMIWRSQLTDRIWKEWNNFVTSEVWWPKTRSCHDVRRRTVVMPHYTSAIKESPMVFA